MSGPSDGAAFPVADRVGVQAGIGVDISRLTGERSRPEHGRGRGPSSPARPGGQWMGRGVRRLSRPAGVATGAACAAGRQGGAAWRGPAHRLAEESEALDKQAWREGRPGAARPIGWPRSPRRLTSRHGGRGGLARPGPAGAGSTGRTRRACASRGRQWGGRRTRRPAGAGRAAFLTMHALARPGRAKSGRAKCRPPAPPTAYS